MCLYGFIFNKIFTAFSVKFKMFTLLAPDVTIYFNQFSINVSMVLDLNVKHFFGHLIIQQTIPRITKHSNLQN